jgi:nitrite reductase/ring-hydroxylating ferredoxin subunit
VTEWIELGPADAQTPVVARVGGREVGVVVDPTDGRAYGLRNRCPHHGAPLCLGSIREREGGAPGRYELSGRRVLRCPWHGWEFDLETGLCLDEPSLRVAVYPAEVADGRARICL